MKPRVMMLTLLLGFGLLLLRPSLGEVSLEAVAIQKAAANAELQAALNDPAAFERLFNEWARAFGKTYASPAERASRAAIFRSNLPRMVQLNSNPAYTFWMQPAFYTDITDEEFVATHYGADYYPRRVAGFPPSAPNPAPAPAPTPAPAPALILTGSTPVVVTAAAPVPSSTPPFVLVNPPTAQQTSPATNNSTPTSPTPTSPTPTSPTTTSPTPTSPTPSSPTPSSPTPTSATPSSPTPTSPTPTSPLPPSASPPAPTSSSPGSPPPTSPQPPNPPPSNPFFLPLPGVSPQQNSLGIQSTSSSIASGLSLGAGAQQATAGSQPSPWATAGLSSGSEAAVGVSGFGSDTSSSLAGGGGGSTSIVSGAASVATGAGSAGGFPFGGRKLAQAVTGNAGTQAQPASEGACTDLAPDSRYTCEQQRGWGKCNAGWMLAGNWCQRTCNRCAPGASPATPGSPSPSSTRAVPPASPLPPAFSLPPSPTPPPVPVPAGVPDVFSWVEQGKVTPVKDQGNCSSCWAFAAAAALESLNAIQRGQLLNVSVQDIIDCSPVTPGYPPRAGCGPGMSTEAMKLTSTSGVTTPPVYGDYTASYGTCKADVMSTAPSGQVLRIPTEPGYVDVTPRSAVAFMRAVALRPITVLLWAPALLRDVRGGIFNAPCPDSPAADDDVRATYSTVYGPGENHEVAVVGYNARAGIGSNTSYITIKNSWGEGVGSGGYFNLRLDPEGSNGLCGIYLFPLLPEPLTE